jgi:UDP-glucose:(glucosyl)LPS alpha-1,2-glucosyltransferase
MTIEFDNFSKKSLGGTEIIKYGLLERLPSSILEKFQIVCDRIEELKDDKIRLFWTHLTPKQSEGMMSWMGIENISPLSNGGWKKFHKIICISYHQMEEYAKTYDIPYSYFVVMKYALNPIQTLEKPKDKIVLFHQSNPSRGLELLVPVFEKLCEEYDNLELKVHSSWKIYGRNDWQKEYEKSEIYRRLENHPKIQNIGYLPNEELKKSLASSHIFAYPCIWQETFCLSLLEAMSAGLLCVHSSLGCLPETSVNFTMMYQFDEDLENHKRLFYQHLKKAILIINQKQTQEHLLKQKEYIDYFFNWEKRTDDWIELLQSLENLPLKKVHKSSSLKYR